METIKQIPFSLAFDKANKQNSKALRLIGKSKMSISDVVFCNQIKKYIKNQS